jgi:hypothetical protein
MSDSTRTLVIQGDKAAIEQIQAAVVANPENKARASQGVSYTGNPNDWMLVCQIVISAVSALSPIVVELIKQKRISYAKVGEAELRGHELEKFKATLDKSVESQ